MEIRWTKTADQSLDTIFSFYKELSERAANRIILDIFTETKYLAIFPQMAPIEPLLSEKNEIFRALLVKNLFKIIYYIDEIADEVVIVTVWDCRQNPEKLTDSVI